MTTVHEPLVTMPPGTPQKRAARRPASAPGDGRKRTIRLLSQFAAIAGVLAVWQLLAISPFVEEDSLPGPIETLQALIRLWGEDAYWTALGDTVTVWAIGLGLCAVVGIPVGLMLGMSDRATWSTRWMIDFFRTIPTIALLPLALLMFGPTVRMEVVLIVLAAIWPLLIQSMYAAKQVEPLLKWVARVFRLSRWEKIKSLWAPSVTLFVFTGLRLAATIALLMTVAAEYIGGAPGLGYELNLMEQAYQRPEVFAYAVTSGALGLIISMTIVFVQRHLLWWHPIIRGERAA